MELTRFENEMLDGRHGPAKQRAMQGLVQLGRAFGAPRMVEIGYAHIHAGMALYLEDVELMEELADLGAAMAVPASVNIANADTVNWRQTGAPEKLVRLQQRATGAHHKMGSACTFTCTPYWAGHWPTWNTHMTSIELTVTVFCNSVLGARSNRDGFFAVYAGMTGRYPLFGYHCDENRRGTHRFRVDAPLSGTTDFSALGFHIGGIVGEGVPVVDGFATRPSLDDLDAMGAGMATSGGVALFIVPGVTPPFADVAQAFGGAKVPDAITVRRTDVDAVYDYFCTGKEGSFDIVHVGCPHASFEEMKHYADLLKGKRVREGVEFWITTSRAVRTMADEAGFLRTLEGSGAKVISDTCPISCHFARTTSPDPKLGVVPPPIRTVVVDSAKQAKYVRDMIRCDTLLTGTQEAVETALTGQFVGAPILMAEEVKARGIVDGTASGPALIGDEAISFLGDVDINTGQVVGDLPSLRNTSVRGTVLIFPFTRGSAGAWRFLYQLFKHGNHPVAIVTDTLPDPSVVQGAILAAIPIACAPERALKDIVANGARVTVTVTGESAVIRVEGTP